MPYGGNTGLRAFVLWEARGLVPEGCQHPLLLQTALRGKKLLNFQIKQWAIGYYDCGGWPFLMEMDAEYRALGIEMPEWVWIAVKKQARTIYRPRQPCDIRVKRIS
jgi:hypothetical protein